MKTEILVAIALVGAGVIGFAYVIITGIRSAKRNRKNGPFKDRP